jgi:uncharacterized radical SAM superfamily Fe-S cluster-containing enzyme
MINLRDHTFLGVTKSLCPECLTVVDAKIVSKRNRIYFRKCCPTHGVREDFVCSDAARFDRLDRGFPGKVPRLFGTAANRGCPYDCGLCNEHEQHTCIALLEITSSCNLTCPMCFAASAPGGIHVPLESCLRAIDHLVEVEGRPEVLQLSGGEPTIHPQFLEILDYACAKPIDVVMINTNGIRLATEAKFLRQIATYRDRAEVYLQFDGFDESHHETLRGKSLLASKLKAIDALGEARVKTTLVCTLQSGVNEDQPGRMVRFAMRRPHVTGVSFQPATYCGRYLLPEQLENRVTFPDVADAIGEQTEGLFRADDFLPLPCAHPNGHTLAYAYRGGEAATPINRFIDLGANLDLLANGIVFTRERAQQLIEQVLSRACNPSGADPEPSLPSSDQCVSSCIPSRSSGVPEFDPGDQTARIAASFFAKAAQGSLQQSDLLRITVTSFMDAYNFDIRQLMKSCVHHLLPSGHLIPFSAYNVLYRDGHLPLPRLENHGVTTNQSIHSAPQLVTIDER